MLLAFMKYIAIGIYVIGVIAMSALANEGGKVNFKTKEGKLILLATIFWPITLVVVNVKGMLEKDEK